MKNLINILLYVLLGLLVVAISVMVYKKFKTNSDSTSTVDNQSDMSYIDSTGTQALPFTAEDSLVLGLTGELPTQVGPDTDHTVVEAQPTAAPQENISPVAQPVSIRETASHNNSNNTAKVEVKAESKINKVTESKAIVKSETKTNTKANTKTESKATSQVAKAETKTKVSKSESTSSNKGRYYVISGSFLVPNNADNQVAKLKKMGFFNAKKVVFTNSSSYSAVAGQYESEAAAKASLNKLKAKGEAGFIKKS